MRRFLAGLCGALLGIWLLAMPVHGQSISIAINNLVTGVTPFTLLRIGAGDYLNWGAGSNSSGYGFRDNSGVIEVKNSGGTWTSITGASGNPINASYWTRVPESSLTNETPMSALATALILNTTTTGVPVAYAGTACTNQFIRSLDLVGAATCQTVTLSTDTTGTLLVPRGGTGLTAGTSGGILAFTGTTTLASSTLLVNHAVLVGGGSGAAPTSLAAGLGTTTTILHGNAAAEPTWGAVVLTTDVSGILPSANGGTGNAFFALSGPATSTKTYTLPNANTTILTTNAAVTAVQGGTGFASYTQGDLLYADSTTTLAKLADVATGNALISGGIGSNPSWGKITLTAHVTGTLPATNGGTGLASYTTGDLLYANSGTTLAARAAVATGSVLVSAGVATAPVWSATPTVTTLTTSTSFNLTNVADATTAPTTSSGFGTGPSVAANNGTAAFTVNVGTGGTASAGVLTMPAATTGWICDVQNRTGQAANRADQHTVQTATTTTSITVQNQTISTGAALAWSASDILQIACRGY